MEQSEEEQLGLTDSEKEDLETVGSEARAISYTGQDFDVEGLVRRLDIGDIKVPSFGHEDSEIEAEGFQRAFVWRKPQMDKFIESILLGYPIPGVFLVKQTDGRYLVLDGQQRLMTLQYFKNGLFKSREFKLENVAAEFKALTYKSFSEENRRTFDNTFIQAIIVNSDGTNETLESIYKIFERLNSGGTQLTPHEIRVALFAGKFIGFLEQLNTYPSWRELYGKKSPRLRDQELVLRVVGLYLAAGNYSSPLKKFLNEVVAEYRDASNPILEKVEGLFTSACDIILEADAKEAFRIRGQIVNAALTEVVLVGFMRRLEEKGDLANDVLLDTILKIKSDPEVIEAITSATANESQVATRLNKAIRYFAEA